MLRRAFAYNINLSALVLGIFIVIVGYKLLSYLPEKYYFTFSKVIEGHTQKAFFVPPPGVLDSRVCQTLNEYGLIKAEYIRSSQGERIYACAQEFGIQLAGYDISIDWYDAGLNEVKSDENISKLAEFEVTSAYRSSGSFNFFIAFLLRMLPAAAAGLFLSQIFGSSAKASATISCSVAAFLFIWPVVLFWDLVVNPSWEIQRNLFFIMYASYIALYGFTGRFFAILGTEFGPYLRQVPVKIDWGKVATGAVQQVVTAGVAAGLTIFAMR